MRLKIISIKNETLHNIMLTEPILLFNKVAQDKASLKESLLWLSNQDQATSRDALYALSFCLQQAHPDQQLIDESLDKIPLKPTMTPMVLFRVHPFKIALAKVCTLPDKELEKSFITLLLLFKYADTRRREKHCKNGCYHEWHNLDG